MTVAAARSLLLVLGRVEVARAMCDAVEEMTNGDGGAIHG
jgi:hypothetical protein